MSPVVEKYVSPYMISPEWAKRGMPTVQCLSGPAVSLWYLLASEVSDQLDEHLMFHLDFLHAHSASMLLNTSSASPEPLPASTPVSVSPPPPTDKLPNLDINIDAASAEAAAADMLLSAAADMLQMSSRLLDICLQGWRA